MDDYEDAKRTPQTEKLLRQFLRFESGVDSKTYHANYDVALGKRLPSRLWCPIKCRDCDFVADTDVNQRWHERLGHRFARENFK